MKDEVNPALTGKRAEGAALWANVDWRDMATFIGPNADRFHRVYEKARKQAIEKGSGFAQGWSWPALLFGFAWFFYRKLWAIGAVLLVLPIAIGYFFQSNGASIGVGVAMAMLAKTIYLQHAVSRIAKARAAGGGEAEIAAAGGASLLGGVIGGAIWLLVIALLAFAIASGVEPPR